MLNFLARLLKVFLYIIIIIFVLNDVIRMFATIKHTLSISRATTAQIPTYVTHLAYCINYTFHWIGLLKNKHTNLKFLSHIVCLVPL